jgi:hypothetical protein
MATLNEVIATSSSSHLVTRDIEGHAVFTRKLALPRIHAFSSPDPEEAEGQPART